MWVSSNKVTPHDWLQLIGVVLEDVPQLLWKWYWRKEAKILEQRRKEKVLETSQDKILDNGHYSDPQDQDLCK